jgi:DNA repair photolyase
MEVLMTERSKGSINAEQRIIYTLDFRSDGVVLGQHVVPKEQDYRAYFALRIEPFQEVVQLKGSYKVFHKDALNQVEAELMRLSKAGLLRRTEFYLGALSDPFIPFEEGFDITMKLLRLFERYIPGHLTIQTRSPLIVIALPSLKALGQRVSVTLGFETPSDRSVRHFTPDLPSASERLKTARSLQTFGLEVTLQVAPLLPYGDWERDAWSFAQLLVEASDHILLAGLTDGKTRSEQRLRKSRLGQKLLREKCYWWLRPDTTDPLMTAIGALAPEKLTPPKRPHLEEKQLAIFAA